MNKVYEHKAKELIENVLEGNSKETSYIGFIRKINSLSNKQYYAIILNSRSLQVDHHELAAKCSRNVKEKILTRLKKHKEFSYIEWLGYSHEHQDEVIKIKLSDKWRPSVMPAAQTQQLNLFVNTL